MASCSARWSWRRSCSVSSRAASGQALSVLHIKVVLMDAERKATPVPRHALLISDNPASAAPPPDRHGAGWHRRRAAAPGNYTVESDQPVAFQGKAYQWTQMVDIAAGRDAVLELTADNAEVEPVTSATPPPQRRWRPTPSFLLPQWQDSVVALWTPTTHASGFVVDAKGLVATNQRVIGTATSVEVQLAPERQGGGERPRGRCRCGTSPSSGSIRRPPRQCGRCRSDARQRRSRPSWTGRSSSPSARRSVSRRA